MISASSQTTLQGEHSAQNTSGVEWYNTTRARASAPSGSSAGFPRTFLTSDVLPANPPSKRGSISPRRPGWRCSRRRVRRSRAPPPPDPPASSSRCFFLFAGLSRDPGSLFWNRRGGPAWTGLGAATWWRLSAWQEQQHAHHDGQQVVDKGGNILGIGEESQPGQAIDDGGPAQPTRQQPRNYEGSSIEHQCQEGQGGVDPEQARRPPGQRLIVIRHRPRAERGLRSQRVDAQFTG